MRRMPSAESLRNTLLLSSTSSRWLLAAALVCAPSAAFAQEAPATTLTLREALARAAAQTPAVRAARARAAAAEVQIDQARAAYYPTLTGAANANVGFSDRPFLPATAVTPATRLQNSAVSADASLTGRITIYDFGRTANAIIVADRSARASREDARSSVRTSIALAATTYITVLADRELISSVRTTITQREAQLRISEGLVTAGARPPIERTRSEVSLDAARLDLTTAEATERSDRAALAASVGLDPTQEIDVAAVAESDLEVSEDPRQAATMAVASRPEFAALRARLALAEAQVDQARAGRNPIISASASGSVSYNEVLTGNGLGGRSESLSGGVNLTWPIFDQGVRASIRVAEANVVSAREALEAQSLQVRTEAVQAVVAAQSARASLTQTERLAAGAAANLEQAQGRYQGGAAPLLELVDAQAADASARIGVVRARATLNLSRARLMAVTGQLEALTRP